MIDKQITDNKLKIVIEENKCMISDYEQDIERFQCEGRGNEIIASWRRKISRLWYNVRIYNQLLNSEAPVQYLVYGSRMVLICSNPMFCKSFHHNDEIYLEELKKK